MIVRIIFFIFSILLMPSLKAQSFWFGAKAGAGLNWQSWGNGLSSGLDRNQLLSVPFDLFIESFDEEGKGSFYAQLGYRTRGSAYRLFSNFGNINTSQQFKFNNLVLEVGIAKTIPKKILNLTPYYKLGMRGEYTLSTNLEDFLVFNSLFYPTDDFVKKWPWGFTVGGGFLYELEDLYGLLFEFTVNPDVGLQYEQPPLTNIRDPYTNQPTSIDLRQVRNLSLEFKLGIRFLRKVEYID
ncbi:MAG: hypothetical protein WAT79_11320 [Saprospiraceae bacterium]